MFGITINAYEPGESFILEDPTLDIIIPDYKRVAAALKLYARYDEILNGRKVPHSVFSKNRKRKSR